MIAVQSSHVVRAAASLWVICSARVPLRKKHNVSCSIRDSDRLFDLALAARGFRAANGDASFVEHHTLLYLLADAHVCIEPAYSE